MDIVLSIFECYQMSFTQFRRLKSRSYGMSKLYNFQNMFFLHFVFSRPDWTHLMYTFHGTFMNQGTGLITKPNAAKIYSHRSPALERFYQETKFLLLKSNKVEPLNVEYQNQAIKNTPTILPSIPFKIWGKLVKGFLSYDLTNEKRLQLYVNTDKSMLSTSKCLSAFYLRRKN